MVAGYNEDDCRATLALRDWLEARRLELAERTGGQLPRPVPRGPPRATEDPEVTRIRSALLDGVPVRPTSGLTSSGRGRCWPTCSTGTGARTSPPGGGTSTCATLSPAELIGEPDALGGLTGGEIVDQVNRSVVRRFSFPPQEHRFSLGETAL